MHLVHCKHVKSIVNLESARKSHSVAGGCLFPPVKCLEHWGHVGLFPAVLQAVRLNTGQIVD